MKPYLVGRDLVSGTGRPTRFVIDFDSLDVYSAQHYEGAFSHVERTVLPEVRNTAKRQRNDRHGCREKATLGPLVAVLERAKGLRTAIKRSPRYLACSRIAKRPILCFVTRSILPDNAIEVFAFPDDYSFGMLQVERPLAMVRGQMLEAD